MEINQKNTTGQLHGYWDNNIWNIHYYNGIRIGYYYETNDYSNLEIKAHLIYGQRIGCERFRNTQYFFKTPNKKFGEEIQ